MSEGLGLRARLQTLARSEYADEFGALSYVWLSSTISRCTLRLRSYGMPGSVCGVVMSTSEPRPGDFLAPGSVVERGRAVLGRRDRTYRQGYAGAASIGDDADFWQAPACLRSH